MKSRIVYILIFLSIFSLAAFLRLYNSNWDQNQHLHPDERFLTMVGNAISWPGSLSEYLNTQTSPLNPHNRGFDFFVYGTFPLFLVKFIAETLGKGDYNHLNIIGRQISALFDLGTVVLVFLIAKNINSKSQAPKFKQAPNPKHQNSNKLFRILNFENWNLFGSLDFGFWIFPLLSMFLYSATVLSIQLSHFFTVDTFLTFFITLAFYLLVKLFSLSQTKILNTKYLILNVLLGISFGLALASKVSALLFLPIIALGFVFLIFKHKHFSFLHFCIIALFIISTYLSFRLANPYAFTNGDLLNPLPNPKFISNLEALRNYDNPNAWFPPGVQWIHTKPLLFPLKNMVFWGLGLPLGVIAVGAILYQVSGIMYYVRKRNFKFPIILSLLWILFLFFYQGRDYVKALRYFHQIYPFIALLVAWLISTEVSRITQRSKIKNQSLTQNSKFLALHLVLIFALCTLSLIPTVSYLSIYSRPTTRIAASDWIYTHIPPGKTLGNEYWDDPLPLYTGNTPPSIYRGVLLPLYDPDTKEKWEKMAQALTKVDYLILSSNRLYGSITSVPERYPLTNRYYRSLFAGTLGFTKVAEFTSRPNIPLPFTKLCLTPPFSKYGIIAKSLQECNQQGISFVDDYADESFTVYDHPKVLIFQKTKQFTASELLNIFSH